MDVIQAARGLGKAIQEDERYIVMRLAKERNDQDGELQDIIGSFSQSREALNAELQKPGRDDETVARLGGEIKVAYAKIFANENMLAYNKAREEFQRLMAFVNQILAGSADGLDPAHIEYKENAASCGRNAADCGDCTGCD